MLKHKHTGLTMLSRAGLACILLFFSVALARAHEYWIEPLRPVAPAAVRLIADARVGQFFVGEALPWLPDAVARLGVVDARGERLLSPLPGDMPMIDTATRVSGVQILFLETKPETLTWETREKFLEFLKEKRLEDVYPLHRRRGLPEAGFRERYVRHAKALLLRGRRGTEMVDRALGMALELVALDDPFALDGEEGHIRVRLLWRGSPLANADVQVFASAQPVEKRRPVHPLHLRTDTQGVVRVPVQVGVRYLLNAVRMEPLPEDSGAVWMSHWASLTFMPVRRDDAR